MQRSVSTSNVPAFRAGSSLPTASPKLRRMRVEAASPPGSVEWGVADLLILYLTLASIIVIFDVCIVFAQQINFFFHPKGVGARVCTHIRIYTHVNTYTHAVFQMRLQIPWFIDSLCNSNVLLTILVVYSDSCTLTLARARASTYIVPTLRFLSSESSST